MSRPTKTPKLDAAFIAAQAEMEPAERNANNPEYNSAYADQEEVHRRARVLLRHGIGYRQDVVIDDDRWWARVTLVHTSGEKDEHRNAICADPREGAHQWERASTYAHRICLARAVGLPIGRDDDGNAAAGRGGGERKGGASGTTAGRSGPDRQTTDEVNDLLKRGKAIESAAEMREFLAHLPPLPHDHPAVKGVRRVLDQRLRVLEKEEARAA